MTVRRSSSPNSLTVDVLIIGSGPSGTAVAERIAGNEKSISVAVVERGRTLLTRHFYASGRSIGERDQFIARHMRKPWGGTFSEGGALLYAVGGRGILGGAQLHRFYQADFEAWENGRWPISGKLLSPYFADAEAQLLGRTLAVGAAQDAVVSRLQHLHPVHPPTVHVLDGHRDVSETRDRLDRGYPHVCSAERILGLCARHQGSERFTLLEGVQAIALSSNGDDTVSDVVCVDSRKGSDGRFRIHPDVVVLAASPIESARLVMGSSRAGLIPEVPAAGEFLAEHVYVQGTLRLRNGRDWHRGPVNVTIPPQGESLRSRFQIEIRTMSSRGELRVKGSAAMDPQQANRVVLTDRRNHFEGFEGAAITEVALSEADEVRIDDLRVAMDGIRESLGGVWAATPQILSAGSSYHEAGTLRMGGDDGTHSADSNGLLYNLSNVYVGDGAAFASIGVANPIVTLTAMGYRLGDYIASIS